MNPYVRPMPPKQTNIPLVLSLLALGAVLAVVCSVGGYVYKMNERQQCINNAEASGVGYSWSFTQGCMYENPWTGTWSRP